MDKNDPEFEETLRDLFSHKIIDSSCDRSEAKQFLGETQGGVNKSDIIIIKLFRNDIDSELWDIEWGHPDYYSGWVEIALTPDAKPK